MSEAIWLGYVIGLVLGTGTVILSYLGTRKCLNIEKALYQKTNREIEKYLAKLKRGAEE